MSRAVVLVATNTEAQNICGPEVIVCGVGAARATAALERAILDHRPEVVISAGFAGALDEQLRVGDVLQPSRIVNEMGATITLDGDGRSLLSLDRVADVHEKPELRVRHGADAVDMETWPLARQALARGLRFVALRSISDPADFALPAESVHWVASDGSPRVWPVLRWSGVRPSRLRLLMALRRHAEIASRRLADAIDQLR